MAKLYNRAKMTTATTGTGTITLGSAVASFQSFDTAGAVSGDVVSYVIEDGASFEYGTGTLSGSPVSTMTRVLGQSSTGSLLNLSGNAIVYLTALAADIANTGTANTFTGAQTFSVGTVNGTGLNISQTWTGTGTYTGLKYNVGTDSGPANAASLLLDLQIGASSKFSVTKSGYVKSPGIALENSDTASTITGLLFFSGNGGWIGTYANTGSSRVAILNSPNALAFGSGGALMWSAQSDPNPAGNIGYDLRLIRSGIATLQLGAADTNASSTVTITIATPGVVAWGSHGLSTGTPVVFSTTGALPTGITAGTTYYAIVVDTNTFQIATSYANATAVSPTAVTTSGSQSGTHTGTRGAVDQVFRVQSASGTANFPGADFAIQGSRGTGTGAGGSIIFQVAPAGSSGTAQNSYISPLQVLGTGGITGVDGATANTLALRNGANAQTYRIYATASGSPGADFQRLTLSAGVTSNMAVVAADNGGSGLAMGLQFGAALTTGGGVTNIFNINTSGHLVWNTTNTYDIGLSAGNRPRNGYFAGSLYAVGGTFGGTALSYYVNGDVASASGGRWYFTASSSVTDPVDVGFSRGGASILTLIGSASSYTIQFGGTTPSFPALKRPTGSTTLQVRLADDSAFAQLTASSLLAAGSTGVVGYSTGAGGAVTQATSRTTGVTLNKGCGQITLVSAAGSTSWQSFTVTNSTVAATDTIIVNQDSGTDLYQIFVTNVAANSFQITFATTGGTTTEQPVFSFAVIKAVTA